MALKFSVSNGGLIQSPKIEFNVTGELTQTVLEPVGAPIYNRPAFNITYATLIVEDAKIGSFNIEVRSYNTDGSSASTHISETVNIASAGTLGLTLGIDSASVSANRIFKLFLQHVSGANSSNISVTLE